MADSSSGRVVEKKRRYFLVGFLIRLVKEKPLGTFGAIVVLFLAMVAIFAGFIAPYGYNDCWVGDRLVAPSAKYWMGTDNVGRDVFSRVVFGARVSVTIGLAASLMGTTISLFIGLICGYIGGKLDLVVQRFVDTVMSIPYLILLMVGTSIIGGSIESIIIVVGLSQGIVGSRIIRGAVIGVRENEYTQAAVAIGCSTTRILIRHILPNILPPTIILFTTRVPAVVMLEATLSFLGFGIPPPFPSWGAMLSGSGRAYMFDAPWMAIWPGVALASMVYSINIFGDAVRDLLDPRLRGGVGRYEAKVKKKPHEKVSRGSRESGYVQEKGR